MYREKKEYKKAQEVLDKIPEIDVDKKTQQALLFESTGKIDEAYGVWESKLWKNAHDTVAALFFIIKLLYEEKKFSEAEEYIERAKMLMDVFDFGAYHKYELDLWSGIEKQDKEKTIESIINMIHDAGNMNDAMKSKIYKHMKFNVTNSISKEKYESLVKGALKKRKGIDFVKDDSRIKTLLK